MGSMRKEEIRAFLDEIRLFQDTSADARAALADKAKVLQLGSDEVVFRKGEKGELFYVVVSGEVAIVLESPSGNQEVSALGRGDFFGEISLMTHAQRTATAKARLACALLVFQAADIVALTYRFPRFKGHLASVGAQRSRDSLSRMIKP